MARTTRPHWRIRVGAAPIVAAALAGAAVGSLLPGPGTVAGSAGGAVAGFGLCLFELALEVAVVNAIIDQKTGGVIPKASEPLVEVPNAVRPPERPDPGKDPFRFRGWAKALGLTLVVSIIVKVLSGRTPSGEQIRPRRLLPQETPKPQVLRPIQIR